MRLGKAIRRLVGYVVRPRQQEPLGVETPVQVIGKPQRRVVAHTFSNRQVPNAGNWQGDGPAPHPT